MTKTNQPRVTYDEAVTRVRKAIKPRPFEHFGPAHLASFVWPGHKMRPQGAAFAVARFLRQMEKERKLVYDFGMQGLGRGYRAGPKL